MAWVNLAGRKQVKKLIVSLSEPKASLQWFIFVSFSTCKDLAKASEVEEPSSGHGEELAHEHQEGDGWEDHGEDHEGLHWLQPF